MVDTSTSSYCKVVLDRRRVTLTAVMNRALNANSRDHSDMWRGYLNLANFIPTGVWLDTVNHTCNFFDPFTGTHIQNVESYWNRIKTWLKPKKGVMRRITTDGSTIPTLISSAEMP